jgi:beta-carotene/zeaxanthin 4-ketolase
MPIAVLDSVSSVKVNSNKDACGLVIAVSIISLWAIATILLMQLDVATIPIWAILPAILGQMFLYTGLFVTAHDAMHGLVYRSAKINNTIGKIALFLYGFISYKKLYKAHELHHLFPATELDPDFYAAPKSNGLIWYFFFMKRYFSFDQIFWFTLFYNGLKLGEIVPEINLILFWLLPLTLSSIQLFYFGTFEPHKPEGGYTNPHRARTITRSFFWSFIACYHFGYHLEHHEHPDVPWWGLPAIVRHKRNARSSDIRGSMSLK